MGSAGSQASYLPPFSSHLNLHVPAPAHSRTAQSTFSAWKNRQPALNPGNLSLARNRRQGHCHTTCVNYSGETEAPSFPASPVSLNTRQSPYRLTSRLQPGLRLGSEASVGCFPTVSNDQGHGSPGSTKNTPGHVSSLQDLFLVFAPALGGEANLTPLSTQEKSFPRSCTAFPQPQISLQVSPALTLPTH